MMPATKFNKRAGKETPVIRHVTTPNGSQFHIKSSNCGELFFAYRGLFKNPDWKSLNQVYYRYLKDWLINKAQ